MNRNRRGIRGAAATRAGGGLLALHWRPGAAVSSWFNHALLLCALIAVLVIIWQALTTLQQRPIRHIVVTGSLEHTAPEMVQALVEPELAGGFLGTDLGRIRELLRQLPWVHDVTIWRRWPDGLEIHVIEELPIARWRDTGLLNHQGRIFAPGSNDAWQRLPLLDGPEGSARDLMVDYLRMIDQLQPQSLRLTALRNLGRGNLELQFDPGFSVVLRRDRLAEQMQRFLAVYHADLRHQDRALQRVDLRYTNGMAVAFADEPELIVATGARP